MLFEKFVFLLVFLNNFLELLALLLGDAHLMFHSLSILELLGHWEELVIDIFVGFFGVIEGIFQRKSMSFIPFHFIPLKIELFCHL